MRRLPDDGGWMPNAELAFIDSLVMRQKVYGKHRDEFAAWGWLPRHQPELRGLLLESAAANQYIYRRKYPYPLGAAEKIRVSGDTSHSTPPRSQWNSSFLVLSNMEGTNGICGCGEFSRETGLSWSG